jgi:hypothetical protein
VLNGHLCTVISIVRIILEVCYYHNRLDCISAQSPHFQSEGCGQWRVCQLEDEAETIVLAPSGFHLA